MSIPRTTASASDWTLRFKHGRHTILLFSDPLTTFASLKFDLHAIMCERYPKGLSVAGGEPVAIPHTTMDIALAIPVDRNDPRRGWQPLPGRANGTKDTPKAMGLKDGGVVAFCFVSPSDTPDEPQANDFVVDWPSFDDESAAADAMDRN